MNQEMENISFDELLSRLTDVGLTYSELEQLGRVIESDSALRTRYLEYCQIHGMLRAEHGLLASFSVPDVGLSSLRNEGSRRLSRLRWMLAVAGAAALLSGLTLVGIWRSGGGEAPLVAKLEHPYRGEVVGRLRKQVHARFVYGPRGETTPPPGSPMLGGTYELESGVVEMESNSGVLLTIEAPATFTLADDQCVHIERGRLAAHVPKEAIGFRVETASATVVDLGTDFAVEAVLGEKSEVHVFEGEVRVNLHGSKAVSASPLSLTSGKATRIDFITGMPSGIDLDETRFLRRLDVQPQSYTQRVLSMRPVVYYPMDPTSDGELLRDYSRNGCDAKITFGRATEPVWGAGKVGLAFALGGPAQQTYASVADYPKAEGNQLSVVAWVTAWSRPRWASIAKNWAGADDRGQFHFGLYSDSGELEAHIQDDSGEEITVKDRVPLPLNQWHHVAFVADGQMLRLYRNGSEVDAVPYRGHRSDPRIKALAIGTKLNLTGDGPDHSDFNMWDGRLDEVAIFNHALSAEEIHELYELGNVEN